MSAGEGLGPAPWDLNEMRYELEVLRSWVVVDLVGAELVDEGPADAGPREGT